jgi:uncharacterized protein (TIGR02145 family)
MKTLTLYSLCIITLFVQSCGDSTAPTSGTNQTVNIGSQVWMTKNLDMSTYRNGDNIRHASTQQEWLDAANKKEGAWCYYNNDPKNGEIYGKLYNWYAVNDPRGLAPLGYHIPNDAEWSVLIDYLGGEQIAGFKMKSKEGWYNNDNGDNSSGFSGLPAGYRRSNFYDVGNYGNWWSSTENNTDSAWVRFLIWITSKIHVTNFPKQDGYSVRCLKD